MAADKKAPAPKKPKRTGLRSIEIRKADNGYTTETRFDTDGDGYDPGDTNVHESKASVLAHVSKHLPDDGDDSMMDDRDKRRSKMKAML